MLQMVVAVATGALVLHWIGCFLVPFLRRRIAGVGIAVVWGITALACCPLVIIATQWRRLPTPGRVSWAIRITAAIVLAVALVKLGDSELNRSPAMVGFKLQLVKMMSPAHIMVRGNRLIGDKQQNVEIFNFGHAPFATAGLIAASSMLLYRNPIEKGLILTLGVFCTSVLFDCIGLSRLVLTVNDAVVDEQRVQMLFDTRQLFHFWLPTVLFFWAAVAWATWDARHVETESTTEPASDV